MLTPHLSPELIARPARGLRAGPHQVARRPAGGALADNSPYVHKPASPAVPGPASPCRHRITS